MGVRRRYEKEEKKMWPGVCVGEAIFSFFFFFCVWFSSEQVIYMLDERDIF